MAGVEEIYREEFKRRVLAGRPRSLLDVGAGRGAFLKGVKSDINRLVGLEPNTELVETLQGHGIEAVHGSAERLPFQDHEFDVVVFSYSPHHLSDWAAALKEAMRVARHSIEILDSWYDDGVPDQRVAHSLDRWCKEIFRRGGMVNNDSLSPGAILEPVTGIRGLTYDYVCRRVSAPCALNEVEEKARSLLTRVDNDAGLAAGLSQILEDARRFGMSEAGCVQMTIELGK